MLSFVVIHDHGPNRIDCGDASLLLAALHRGHNHAMKTFARTMKSSKDRRLYWERRRFSLARAYQSPQENSLPFAVFTESADTAAVHLGKAVVA